MSHLAPAASARSIAAKSRFLSGTTVTTCAVVSSSRCSVSRQCLKSAWKSVSNRWPGGPRETEAKATSRAEKRAPVMLVKRMSHGVFWMVHPKLYTRLYCALRRR